jgi:hypothetical protein
MNIMDELFDMQKIYHRAIFDCFNEGLFGLVYSPELSLYDSLSPAKKLPAKEKKLSFLEQSKEHVLDCATILCGIIKDKEDSMMGNIRYMENEFISQLREDRMYRMITLDVSRF